MFFLCFALRKMIGESKKLMVFVSAGNGFQSSHWHEEEDVLDIVQYRLKAQKLIKLASEQRSEEKIYCGNPNAQVEYLQNLNVYLCILIFRKVLVPTTISL